MYFVFNIVLSLYTLLAGFSGVAVTDQSTQLLLTNLEQRARELLDNAKTERVGMEFGYNL